MNICVVNDLGNKQNRREFHFKENDTITNLFNKVISGLKMNTEDKKFFNKEINQRIDLPDEIFLSCLLRCYEDFIYKRGTDFSKLYSVHREKYLKPRKIKPEFDFKTIRLNQCETPKARTSVGFGFLNLAMDGLSSIFGSGNSSNITTPKNIMMRSSVMSEASNVESNEINYYSDEDEDYDYYSRGRYYEWDD
jgi:hypothetical protein